MIDSVAEELKNYRDDIDNEIHPCYGFVLSDK